jgi:hypothetical protein
MDQNNRKKFVINDYRSYQTEGGGDYPKFIVKDRETYKELHQAIETNSQKILIQVFYFKDGQKIVINQANFREVMNELR